MKVCDVIISLTSTPDRINYSKKTLDSILKQTYLPKKVVFNIPYFSSKGKEYIIPDWLLNISRSNSLVEINRCNKDYGPATKLIPTLLKYKDNSDQKIIFIDDDQIYPKKMIEKFYNISENNPEKVFCGYGESIESFKKHRNTMLFENIYLVILICIILLILLCYFCIRCFKNKNWLILSLILLILVMIFNSTFPTSKKIDIIFGVSGVLVKPKFFNLDCIEDINNYPKCVFYNDDIYFSGMLKQKGIDIYQIYYGIPLPVIHPNIFDSLMFTANKNSKDVTKALEYFNF